MRLIDGFEDWLHSRYVQQNMTRVDAAGELCRSMLRELDRQGLWLDVRQGVSFRRVALIYGRYLVAEIDTRPLPPVTLKGLRGSMVLRGLRAALGQPVLLTHHQDWIELALDLGDPPRSENWFFIWLQSLPAFLRKQRPTIALGAPNTCAIIYPEA